MNDMITYVIVALSGAASAMAFSYFIEWMERPYSWSCSLCDFQIRANAAETVDVIRGAHLDGHSRTNV